jgi:hemolysin activation/secretion protein
MSQHDFSLFARSAALSLGLLMVSTAAFAQIPSTVEPGRVQTDINRQTAPAQIPPTEDVTATPDVQAPAGSEKVRFTLKRIDVAGAKQMPQSEIESLYKNKIGKAISLADVYDIANRITRAYRDNGFMLSRAIVPQQEIGDGVVKITVVEGFVSGYNIQGDAGGSTDKLNAYAKKLVGTGTLSVTNLERYLLLMNDLPGIKVRSVLSPSRTVANGADVTFVVEKDVFEGIATVDNFGNDFIGEERLTVGGQLNSIFSTEQLNGTFLWVPDHSELYYYNAGFRQNIGNEGTKFGLNASYSLTSPDLPGALAALGTEGKSFNYGFTLDHPFIRSRRVNVVGGIAFDVTKNKTNYPAALSAIETKDEQRVLRINGQTSYLDGLAGYNVLGASVSQGFEILGSSEKGDAQLSRAEGDPGFTKLSFDVSRLQRIWGPVTALFAGTGQVSADPLLASEEFGFGGDAFGRGYDSSEITGDHGLAGKIELIYTNSPDRQFLNQYQLYTFYDLGAVWNKDPGAGQDSRESAASAGIGARLAFTPDVRGEAFLAKPLTRDIPSRGVDDADNIRFKFVLSSNF